MLASALCESRCVAASHHAEPRALMESIARHAADASAGVCVVMPSTACTVSCSSIQIACTPFQAARDLFKTVDTGTLGLPVEAPCSKHARLAYMRRAQESRPTDQ